MKLWPLVSYLRSEPAILERVFNDPKWARFAQPYREFTHLVRQQNRALLDLELPDELCREALALVETRYIIMDGNLYKIGGALGKEPREILTALQVFDRYGGECLEEVSEYGSCRLAPTRKKIKLMPDYSCWPLWTSGGEIDNLDPKSLPISAATRQKLAEWQTAYDKTLNQEYPPDSKFKSAQERDHFNALGRELLQMLRMELGDAFEISYQNHHDPEFHG